MMHWVGLTDLTYADYTVFGQVNLDPGGLMVGADSPYKDAKSLLEDIKAKPEKTFKASGTGQGGIWHLGYGRLAADRRRRCRQGTVGAEPGICSGTEGHGRRWC